MTSILNMIRESREECKQIRKQGEEECARILSEADKEIERINDEYRKIEANTKDAHARRMEIAQKFVEAAERGDHEAMSELTEMMKTV